MFCEHCGKPLSDNQAFCHNCGAPTGSKPIVPVPSPTVIPAPTPALTTQPSSRFHCPHCGSRDLYPMTTTDTTFSSTGGGYSAGKGCLGYFLLGPLGLLCGACGSKTTTTMESSVKNYWSCRSCGKKFMDIDNLNALLAQEQETLSGLQVRLGLGLVILIPFAIYIFTQLQDTPTSMMPLWIILLLFIVLVPFINLSQQSECKQRYAALAQEKAFIEQYAYGKQNVVR